MTHSQFPPGARLPMAPGMFPPENPNEKHVDAAQRQQAMEFLQRMMTGGQGGYVPIMKQLGIIGIKPHTLNVTLPGDDVSQECLVIPVSELMEREWKHMSEIQEVQENIQT